MRKLISVAETCDMSGHGKTWLYKNMGAGGFPRGCKVGRRTLFVLSEVQAWIDEQIAERDTRTTVAAVIAANRAARQGATA